jgi:IclR family acetate operon transcriptional repressor
MVAGADAVSAYPIRSVDRVCDILDALASAPGGVSLTEVADATGLPKSSAFRYLSALEARHYIERGNDSVTYRLGLAFRPQHTRTVAQLADLARPALLRMRDKIGETTNLGMLDGTNVVHAVVCESPQMMRLAAREGERGDVHATALGKAMAALLPEDRVRSLIAVSGMARLTDATITDLDRLLVELETVRTQGYAVDEEEHQKGGRCVAVAIPGLSFPAAVSISAPAARFTLGKVPAAARALQRLAKDLSRRMAG